MTISRVKAAAIAGVAYAAIGVLAFGHAAANEYREETAAIAQCRRVPSNVCFDDRTVSSGGSGLMAALFWPLYLSWEAWS